MTRVAELAKAEPDHEYSAAPLPGATDMDKSKNTEPVRRLTDQEIADLRADMQQAAEWTRKELARRRQEKSTDSPLPRHE